MEEYICSLMEKSAVGWGKNKAYAAQAELRVNKFISNQGINDIVKLTYLVCRVTFR